MIGVFLTSRFHRNLIIGGCQREGEGGGGGKEKEKEKG
jgi:hypothetical protein